MDNYVKGTYLGYEERKIKNWNMCCLAGSLSCHVLQRLEQLGFGHDYRCLFVRRCRVGFEQCGIFGHGFSGYFRDHRGFADAHTYCCGHADTFTHSDTCS